MLKLIWALLIATPLSVNASENCADFLNHELPKLHSEETVNLCKLAAGRAMLVINTASYCGYTRQFEGLETLHQKYKDKGLFVVGFASNDFYQEASSEQDTANICRLNYGVTFTMIAPSLVKGPAANPVFEAINKQSEQPSWNFNKYLINSDGKVVNYFPSQVEPDSEQLKTAIEALL
ncbi:UNVERIFIED_CONTAM: hypothetical protein GTU68_031955 [Idotea baltica]|nr:hypothetical protein [Idotea baltica]